MNIHVNVPATTANLGPGFDALGLALDLWNESTFAPADEFSVQVTGEGVDKIPVHRDNLILRAAQRLAELSGKSLEAFQVDCLNRIPFGSGLGSSAAATLTGLLGANAWLGSPLSNEHILNLATEIEGHSDNVAPALLGGLTVSTMDGDKVIARCISVADGRPPLHITVVVPDFHFATREARAALPKQVTLRDAIHNISRAVLVAEAFRTGDLDLLGQAMTDALHQPYRLPLIPGAQAAMDAAKGAGAAAAALSGAGPSLIAFSSNAASAVGAEMKRAFEESGIAARVFHLGTTSRGAHVESK
ncbi:MAG TPA: homoserine kinase [Anaerolineales bacterium]|jgi:homoserine kinase